MTPFTRFSEKHPIISVVIVSAACFLLSLPVIIIVSSLGYGIGVAESWFNAIHALGTAAFTIPIMLRAIRLEMKRRPRRYILIAFYGFLALNFLIAAIMSITTI